MVHLVMLTAHYINEFLSLSDASAAFKKFQEEQDKKKAEGKVNSAEQCDASVNFMKVIPIQ